MKHRALLAALFAVAVLTVAPASAQNLSGTWELSTETGRGTQAQTLTLVAQGSTLTGTVTSTGGVHSSTDE